MPDVPTRPRAAIAMVISATATQAVPVSGDVLLRVEGRAGRESRPAAAAPIPSRRRYASRRLVADMNDFPSGMVTFLFTDVEGSTRMLERLGNRYGAVRERHDEILRTAIVEDGGRVVDTAGDGFFAVFPSPRRAVSAAARAQRELGATDWPDGVALAVRMGLHTGE